MDPYETLIHLICHAPPCPIGYLEEEWVPCPNGVGTMPKMIPPAERQARWRMEYADAQLTAIERRNQPSK
jgi:hypothetical protein